jgi:hypothetical protein
MRDDEIGDSQGERRLSESPSGDDEIELKRGDVFKDSVESFQIVDILSFNELVVTNPLVNHPQDASAGTWKIKKDELKEDLRNGNVERAELEVK